MVKNKKAQHVEKGYPALSVLRFFDFVEKEDFFRKKSHDFLKKLLQNSQKYIII